MKIVISNSSSTPIYLQIKNSIIEQISNNEIKMDEPLPSIRTLASEIKISVMTIKKAYQLLEQEGYIVTVAGKGSFVGAKSKELSLENAKKEIENNIQNIVSLAKKNGILKEDIIDAFNIYYGEEENEHN
ncbi:MAG: GntR family transcriptional regulator [Erysipelotrichaceae bacterium]